MESLKAKGFLVLSDTHENSTFGYIILAVERNRVWGGLDMSQALMILVAGPYRSGTNDDPARIQANVDAMTNTGLKLFRLGHLPVLGEWLALPLIAHAGSRQIGDEIFDEIFHPISRELVTRCDACLRIGGPSKGADEMVSLARSNGKKVFLDLAEIPLARAR
jgi:hypothetical protein